jgi:ribonuclease G
MSAEILVNVTPMETRVALIEDGAVQDIYIERTVHNGMVGNIYAGKVVRVLPGMQAAFVDIGVERTSFLHVSDLVAVNNRGRARDAQSAQQISAHLREGEKVIVQVVKDPSGSKGARLTTELSLSTRHLVLLPQTKHIGVSHLIGDATERSRLQQVLGQAAVDAGMDGGQGFILRTAAEGVAVPAIAADLRYLKQVWSVVSERAKMATGPGLLYEDLPLQLRTVRDLARPQVQCVLVDSAECFDVLMTFCESYVPEMVAKVQLYRGERPLFDMHGVEDDIRSALGRRVELESGGYLIIDQTEAMTTIDVNTGSFVGRGNHAETILKTNLEAATALARQLRLRNVGGIVIVDFIDMNNAEHRQQVQRTLEGLLQRDPAHSQVSGVSQLGLVEMTRRRTRDSLQRLLCEACPACEGRGAVKTAETVCYDIFRGIVRLARDRENAALLVLAAPPVVDRLQNVEAAHLAGLGDLLGKAITLRAQPNYRQEQFDVVLL